MWLAAPISIVTSILMYVGMVIVAAILLANSCILDNQAEFGRFKTVQVPMMAIKMSIASGSLGIAYIFAFVGYFGLLPFIFQLAMTIVVVTVTAVSRHKLLSWMNQYSREELYDLLKYTFINRYGRTIERSYAADFLDVSRLLLVLLILTCIAQAAFVLFYYEEIDFFFLDLSWTISDCRNRKRREKARKREQARRAAQDEQVTVELGNIDRPRSNGDDSCNIPGSPENRPENENPFGSVQQSQTIADDSNKAAGLN